MESKAGFFRGSLVQMNCRWIPRSFSALRLPTPPMETPDPPSDTPGASKQVVLTPHDIPRSLRVKPRNIPHPFFVCPTKNDGLQVEKNETLLVKPFWVYEFAKRSYSSLREGTQSKWRIWVTSKFTPFLGEATPPLDVFFFFDGFLLHCGLTTEMWHESLATRWGWFAPTRNGFLIGHHSPEFTNMTGWKINENHLIFNRKYESSFMLVFPVMLVNSGVY